MGTKYITANPLIAEEESMSRFVVGRPQEQKAPSSYPADMEMQLGCPGSFFSPLPPLHAPDPGQPI